MNKEILIEPINLERQSSFWYCEERDVAYFSLNDRYIKVEVIGEIIVDFDDETASNKGYLKNAQAVHYAVSKNLTDKDLNKLMTEDRFSNSNWFEFLCKKGEDEDWEEIEGLIFSTVTEFIEEAEKLLYDDEFWKSF